MKQVLAALFTAVLGTVLIALFSGRLLGWWLEPKLEDRLTRLFELPVHIEGLLVYPWPGGAEARRLTFENEPVFSQETAHLDVAGVWFDISFMALKEKHVKIRHVLLHEPVFVIERKLDYEGDPRNNVAVWGARLAEKVRRARERRQGKPSGWEVSIGTIEIEDGTFIYQSRLNGEVQQELVFRKLDGRLSGFHWPTANPAILEQQVQLQGVFGELFQTPVHIEGGANFATSRVSFDLKGSIQDGNLALHPAMWEGLPLIVKKGTFDLKVHAVSHLRELSAVNELMLYSLEVDTGPKAGDVFWGLPMMAAVDFLRTQEVIRLEIPVRGQLSDPEFEYHRAFRRAFQEALQKKTAKGVEKVKESAAWLATGVVRTPQLMVEGLEKLKLPAEAPAQGQPTEEGASENYASE